MNARVIGVCDLEVVEISTICHEAEKILFELFVWLWWAVLGSHAGGFLIF